ncbi:hypothetical protein D3C81_1409580 [compost metagenome]
MQGFTDQLVGDMRSIEIGGINVVHPSFQRCAQHGDRRIGIFWRAEYVWPRQLHGTVAHTVHCAVAQ